MEKRNRYLITIEKLDHQGRGIAHVDNHTVFVWNALPGEEVEIEITFVKKKIAEANVLRYLKKDANRVEPICPYYGICGGCDLMHMSLEKQKEFKQKKVEEILEHYASYHGKINPLVVGNPYFYRNKVLFQKKDCLGFFQKKSTDIISIDSCYLLNQEMNDSLKKLVKINFSAKQVLLRISQNGKMIIFDGKPFKQASTFLDSFDVVGFKENKNYEFVSLKSKIIEKMNDFSFEISPDSFFQVNTEIATKMYEKVVEYAKLTGKENVLDLYCGTGTIGIFLSPNASRVVGIEVNEQAILNAKENKKRNHRDNIEFFCGDAGKVLDSIHEKFDVVVVDPPRAGLDDFTKKTILTLRPKRIIYVSCDPMTLARDLNFFEKEYEVLEVTPFDMFPNTYHVECVCMLNRR